MSRFKRQSPRLKLDPEAYRQLSREVLARDGFRCQDRGTAQDLQIHHLCSRSRLGDDVEENLITLCAGCHRARHLHRQTAQGQPGDRARRLLANRSSSARRISQATHRPGRYPEESGLIISRFARPREHRVSDKANKVRALNDTHKSDSVTHRRERRCGPISI